MDESTREEVRDRAGGFCEYYHLPEAYVLIPFHTEHITAKQHGGTDSLGNLAFSCQRCNLHKGPNLTSIDQETKKLVKIFNPRRHKWAKHFRWEGPVLVGKTAVGRATVAVLAMNEPERLELREELLAQGLLPQ